ncbi:MAG: FkbM family methyltransferase [Sulfuricurvum sp.]
MTNSVISKKLFNGKKIFLYPNCNVSTMYAYTAIPDQQEILLLRKLALKHQKNTIFLDIGANIGSYSVCMMDLCDHIIAFEPHPYTAKRCKMNFLLNDLSESNVQQLALADQTGKIYFSDFGGSSTVNHIIDDTNGIEVNVSTLDNFILENTYPKDKKYILKVDVEGFEEQLFLGGKDFLTNYDIVGIVFECFSEQNVFDLLHSYGYNTITQLSENNYFASKNAIL